MGFEARGLINNETIWPYSTSSHVPDPLSTLGGEIIILKVFLSKSITISALDFPKTNYKLLFYKQHYFRLGLELPHYYQNLFFI